MTVRVDEDGCCTSCGRTVGACPDCDTAAEELERMAKWVRRFKVPTYGGETLEWREHVASRLERRAKALRRGR